MTSAEEVTAICLARQETTKLPSLRSIEFVPAPASICLTNHQLYWTKLGVTVPTAFYSSTGVTSAYANHSTYAACRYGGQLIAGALCVQEVESLSLEYAPLFCEFEVQDTVFSPITSCPFQHSRSFTIVSRRRFRSFKPVIPCYCCYISRNICCSPR